MASADSNSLEGVAGDVYDADGAAQNGDIVEEKPALEFIYISENKLKYINNNYEKVNAKMYDYKCDVKLVVGKSNFKGHRKVLADASDYFSAMFNNAMKEKDEMVIELKDISPDGFGAMLDYFYHGHVTVEEKIVPDILEAARFFHVEWILDICCDYMIRHLSMLDYPLTMELADRYSLGDLRYEIFKFFGNNLPTLIEKENFLKELSVELLLQFLMEFMYLILRWVEVDKDGRKEHCLPLLRQMRFHTMELEELEEIPREALEFKEIRDECLRTGEKYHARGSRKVVVVSGFNDDLEQNIVLYKDPENEEANVFVEQLGQSGLNCDYTSMSQTSLGNFLFAAGGYNDEYIASVCVYRYDPRFREWTEIASLSKGRVSFAFCSSKNRLFAIGGVFHCIGDVESGEEILSSMEVYAPEENAWKEGPSLPFGMFDLAAVYCDNSIYISGGISVVPDHTVPIQSMFRLQDGAREWSPLPDMLVPRQGHGVVNHGGKLYFLGGYTSKPNMGGFVDCNQNDMFDLETQQWTTICSTPEDFGHLFRQIACVAKKIFFLVNKDSEIHIYFYDTEKDELVPGSVIAANVHKVSVLDVAYPLT
ncbi:KLH31-like protein [Mya arenaria]|uniref:KLH31-like protein n=1 Tax=Mya arenaria TaxID=6604 RepID=A0ABY7FXA2_MYAAR|nr:KLH31-like protein [Mya arenaria]